MLVAEGGAGGGGEMELFNGKFPQIMF